MNRFTAVIYPLAGFALFITGATWIYRPLGPLFAGAWLLYRFVILKKPKPE